jgi:5-formyltetrahydrofolate cyclo-ligase
MTDSDPEKKTLRAALRHRRQSLSLTAQRAAARLLIDSVRELPCWEQAKNIALYHARDGEIDTHPLAEVAREASKYLFLPVLGSGQRLNFARWNAHDTPSQNHYLIPEPPLGAERCPASDLDIIFLPLVGWDRYGGRLGMGGGYYDRTLCDIEGPVLVGLAHECQQVATLPQEDWDIRLDYIATDSALYRRHNSKDADAIG